MREWLTGLADRGTGGRPFDRACCSGGVGPRVDPSTEGADDVCCSEGSALGAGEGSGRSRVPTISRDSGRAERTGGTDREREVGRGRNGFVVVVVGFVVEGRARAGTGIARAIELTVEEAGGLMPDRARTLRGLGMVEVGGFIRVVLEA